jgi:hypothetical protein
MSDLIDAVIKTRDTTARIFANSLTGLEGNSEIEIAEKVLAEVRTHTEIFPEGWYSPPPQGVAVLLDTAPFNRLRYDSLRKPAYWPNETSVFGKESVGMIYFSPVDRKTGMLGDIGFTLYRGENQKIKQHIKNSYHAILEIAKYASVGTKLSEICSFAAHLFEGKFKITRWVTMSSDLNQSMNLGHSVPGSFEDGLIMGVTFDEIKEAIRTKRVHVIDTENFKIPETCAFTIESRLEDLNNPDMPSVYFHFMVCFNKGEKIILENFDEIFSAVGMDYMNSK